jgi:3'-phosphoadenosine 5'-phosphosulfate sulfotransferase (PAPS reductase)/FAD synthetase
MLNDVMEQFKDEAIRLNTPDLTQYDRIVINSSGGKDSQAMTDYVCGLAREQGSMDRVVMVHADLGRVEWKGTRELAEAHANHYGIKFVVVRREKGDLLQQVRERGMWPDNKNRYCTSDQKRDQVAKFHTKAVADLKLDRPAKILNCMGFRADESPARAKKPVYALDTRGSNGKRQIFNWLPIHHWSVKMVWDTIKASGVKHHPAYDLGMPRLSCCFCIFAPKAALMIAGKHNPELLAEYVQTEQAIGHTFRNGFKIAEVQEALARGEEPGEVRTWTM